MPIRHTMSVAVEDWFHAGGVRVDDANALHVERNTDMLELVPPCAPYPHHNRLWEAPVAVLQLARFWHLPRASGASMRLLPPRLFERVVARFEPDVGAGVFYLHPWELDPESPTGPGSGRWILRAGRTRLAPRLEALLRGRRCVSMRAAFPQLAA
ncbi:MAG: DUF3473 domain-containing protein [bacterium]